MVGTLDHLLLLGRLCKYWILFIAIRLVVIVGRFTGLCNLLLSVGVQSLPLICWFKH